MFYGNPRINNGAGVYQNGGGGDGSFTVDLGGGVSQKLTFPPYLVPVEYIDTSDYTGTFFTIRGDFKFLIENNDEMQAKIAFDTSKISSGAYVFSSALANGENEINATAMLEANNNKRVWVYWGNIQTSITGPNLHVDDWIKVKYTGSQKKLLVTDGFGNSQTYYSTNSYNNYKQGMWGVFGLPNAQPPSIYKGKFFYMYVTNGNNIKALFVPARNKDSNITEPYIVECVSGIVGINGGKDWSTSGIAFGPDIDLSEEASNWIT